MNNSNTTTLNAIVVFVVAIIIVVSWKILLPGYFDSKLKLENVKAELSQDKEKLESIQKAKADLDAVSNIKDKIFVAFSKDSDSPNTISELEAIAIKNNLVIPSIDITQAASDASFTNASWSQVNVAFTVIGDFPQLSAFMASLEKSIKFMDIKTINYGLSADGKYSLALQLNAYSALIPSAPADGATEAE